MSRKLRNWLIIGAVLLVLAVTAGPWLYINVFTDDPPERLGFDDRPTATTGSDGDAGDDAAGDDAAGDDPASDLDEVGLSGAWAVADGSEAGYRVPEILFGQETEAVGRTTDVTGSLTVSDTTIETAEVEVDLTTVESDQPRRDGQFQGRIMDTDTFPTAAFTLTEPIELDGVPDDLEEVAVQATGEFSIRGVTREVTVDLTVRRNGDAFEVVGAIPVVFADYDIPNPTGGPAQVGDEGEIEILLVLERNP